jgi:emp24/gp25L/p24 family/GOLD
MHLVDAVDEERANDAIIPESSNSAEDADGQDAEWNRRMKEKLERMKEKKMRDMSITVTQKAGLTGILSTRQRKQYGEESDKIMGQGRVREELTKRQGTILFLTGEDDGTIDICVQSIVANRNSPSRIALNVTMAADEEVEENEAAEVKSEDVNHEATKTHMSRLDRELHTLNSRVRAILNNADFNKNQQGAFIDQSVAIHSAAMYWPIIQVLIIIITGITQANHIIRYMRTHHIGI